MFSFFRRKPLMPQPVLDFIGADMHNHLIPGIDDGSPDVDTSLRLMEGLLSLGYRAFFCTPHVIMDVHPNNSATIEAGFDQLALAVKEKGWPVQLGYAAEYMINYDMDEMVAKKDILPLAGKYVLVEMSYAVESPNIRDTLFQLQTKGWRPILAHPERYPYYHYKMSNYENLLDAGAEFQINLLSLTGYYGKPIQKMAEKLIELQWVNWLGTDLHHERHLQALFGLCQQKRAMNYLHKIKHLKNASLMAS